VIGALHTRLYLILLAPLLLAGGFSAIAVYDYVRETHIRLARERLAVIAEDISETIQSSVDLGLPLSALPQIQRSLEEARRDNQGISAITAYVTGGVVQFSTDRATIGELVPPEWLAPDGELRSTAWSDAREQDILVGAPVINSFHQPVGGVVLRVSSARLGLDQIPSLRLVGIIGLGFLALSALLAALAARVMARLVAAPLMAMTTSLGAAAVMIRDGAGQAADPPDHLAAELAGLVVPITAAEQTLRQIDEAV